MKFRHFEVIALSLILALAAYLRLTNLADNPGWYTDEGTHLDIAQNLLCGRVQYLAINQSTLLFAKLPLFDVLLAGLLGVSGGGIDALRALTGALGVVSVGMLYLVVRRAQRDGDISLPLLAALLFAIYPQAVLYSRFGFSYNLLTPLVLLTCLGLFEYLSGEDGAGRGWLALAALAIGIGGVSDLWMLSLVVPAVLVVSTRRWRDLLWSLLLMALPFGLYAAAMLARSPQVFLFDLRFTLSRLNRLPPLAQLKTLALNYTVLVSQDYWMALGIVGLFLLRPARLQRLSLLLFLLPVAVLGRTTSLYSLGFYYMVPLLPFVGLGMAAVVTRGVPYVLQVVQGGLLALLKGWEWVTHWLAWQRLQDGLLTGGTNLISFLLIATPFLISGLLTVDQVHDRWDTHIDPFLINPGDARRVAVFVNEHTDPGDLVVASPGIAWLLRANVADVQMSVAATGQETGLLPANIPAERFAFDPRHSEAHFVIVDNLWRNWAVWDVAGAANVLRDVETWPLVFEAGEIEVYCNPPLANRRRAP